MPNFAEVLWSSERPDQGQGQECSVWLDQGTCGSLEIFMGEMVCKITTRDLHPPKKLQHATGLPTNVLVPREIKEGRVGIQYPGIQSSKLFSLYAIMILIWDTPNQNCLTYHPIYSVSYVNTASQSFCISWNFSSSKSCGFSTASSSQTALDFKGSALVVSILSQSRIKLDCQETHPPKKNIVKRSFLSYIQEFPLGPCHHSLLSQTCSWRTKGPTVWCKGCSCGGTALCDGMFVIGAKWRGDSSPNSNIYIYT